MSDAAKEKELPSTVRIEAFSDGVIAIIATIMVLELHEPALTFMTGDLRTVFDELAPDLFVYAISFFMVAILLVNHHGILRMAPHATAQLYWWNTNLLFWMALIPLSTAAYGKHPMTALAAGFYALIMAATMVSLALLRRSVLAEHGGGYSAARIRLTRRAWRRDLAYATLYLVALPLGYISEFIPMAIFVAIPVAHIVVLLRPARH